MGSQTKITYLSMSSPEVYTRSAMGTDPRVDGNGYPRAVVALGGRSPLVAESRVWKAGTSSPLSGNARYFYKDSRSDAVSGSRGFGERWIFTESTNTLEHVVNYQGLGGDGGSIVDDVREFGQVKYRESFAVANDYLAVGTTSSSLSRRQATLSSVGARARALSAVPPGAPNEGSPFILLQSTVNTLTDTAPANPRFRYVGQTVTRTWDVVAGKPLELPQSETATAMDIWGNVKELVQTARLANGGAVWRRVTTTNTFADNPSKWLLGRIARSTVKTEAASAADQLALYGRSAGRGANAADVSSNVPASRDSMSPDMLATIVQSVLFSD